MASLPADQWGGPPRWGDPPSPDEQRRAVRRRPRATGCSPFLILVLVVGLSAGLIIARAAILAVTRPVSAEVRLADPIEAAAFLAPVPFPTRSENRPNPTDRSRLAVPTSPTPTDVPATPRPTPRPPPTTSKSPALVPTPSPRPTRAPSPTVEPVLVFLDAGHGGVDTGTIGTANDGTLVDEKTIALALAQRTAAHLRADGISVALSRSDDSLPGSTPNDYTSDGKALTVSGVFDDLQRRIDRANASGAAVLLSIHLNAYTDPAVAGAETFYDASRPFAAANRDFGTMIQSDLIAALRANGFDTPDRGAVPDTELVTPTLGATSGYDHLILLGPAIPGQLRPSEMPAALTEPFFLTNPTEATAILDPTLQDLIATAYARAIEQFLRQQAVG